MNVKKRCLDRHLFYPALTGCKTPTSTWQQERRHVGGRSTARKSPICSPNNLWGMKKTPTD
ncbi:hypothetical protein CEW92_12195 [Bacillaceae bacterium SAS-127]|nr:hypothetical protein CEW92_12195 [Bacillaceae bacterium SAS-127]